MELRSGDDMKSFSREGSIANPSANCGDTRTFELGATLQVVGLGSDPQPKAEIWRTL